MVNKLNIYYVCLQGPVKHEVIHITVEHFQELHMHTCSRVHVLVGKWDSFSHQLQVSGFYI